ncbi:MAG: FISUMP domain-containing protein [Prolixibacteraceae bacterium]
MKNQPFLLFLFTLICTHTFSQNIELKVSAEYLNNYTAIDSLVLENLSNQSQISFNILPAGQTYIINANNGTVTSSRTIKNELSPIHFRVLSHSPGKIQLQFVAQNQSNVGIQVFNINGQKILEQKIQILEPGNYITIELTNPGIHLVYLYDNNSFQTVKILGNEKQTQNIIDIQNGSVNFKQQLLSNNYYFEPGDSLKIQAFKANLYSKPVFLKATESIDLHFVFDSLTPLFYFMDERDSSTYKASKIGKQIWMAENLVYETSTGSIIYKSNQENLITYGRLYNWETAKTACPAGWYLPEIFEWQELIDYTGQKSGVKLKSTWGWYNGLNGTDDFNFCGLPGGFGTGSKYFYYLTELGKWWTASNDYRDTIGAYNVRMYYKSDEMTNNNYSEKEYYYSVRCLKTNPDLTIVTDTVDLIQATEVILSGQLTVPNLTNIDQMGFYWSPGNQNPSQKDSIILVSPTQGQFQIKLQGLAINTTYYVRAFAITSKGNVWGNVVKFKTIKESFIDERDGLQYDIMKIGNTTWMAENLAFMADSNCWAYNDDESNAAIYGRLYTWETAKTVCPQDWHLPANAEWRSLAEYVNSMNGPFDQYDENKWSGLGNYLKAEWGWEGKNLKENRMDPFGFSAIGAGYRASNKTYQSLGEKANWWTADFHEYSLAKATLITNLGWNFYLTDRFADNGLSVRCVKDFIKPSLSTLPATEKTYESAVLNGQINDAGFEIMECGFYWSQLNPEPYNSDSMAYSELKNGNISVDLFNLLDTKTLYYRIFVKYKNGEVIDEELGDVLHFTMPSYPIPVAITYDATDISTNSARLNGNINFLSNITAPITQRGFYWSNKSGYSNIYNNSMIIEGETGNYSGTIDHLTPNTTYYFMAFATTKKQTQVGHIDSLKTKAASGSTITDQRDGKIYKTVTIGNQIWMAENLNFKTENGSWSYNNNEENTLNYGRLYNWETAMQACPAGWHLPDYHEWEDLANFIGPNAGLKLKSTSGWTDGQNGTDEFAFTALPGGVYNGSDYYTGLTTYGEWWSSTLRTGSELAYTRGLRNYDNGLLLSTTPTTSDLASSVRCIKGITHPELYSSEATFIFQNSAILNGDISSKDHIQINEFGFVWSTIHSNPTKSDHVILLSGKLGKQFYELNELTANTTYHYRAYASYPKGISYSEVFEFKTSGGKPSDVLIDARNNKQYRTVQIGDAIWMAENLAYRASYDTDSYNRSNENDSIYGRLYSWENAQNACPAGWHLPGDDEWEKLAEYLNQIAGPFKKEDGNWKEMGSYLKAGWNWKGNHGTDEIGFAALPGGVNSLGVFSGIENNGYWWTANEGEDQTAWGRYLNEENGDLFKVYYDKNQSISVRCVKD